MENDKTTDSCLCENDLENGGFERKFGNEMSWDYSLYRPHVLVWTIEGDGMETNIFKMLCDSIDNHLNLDTLFFIDFLSF